MFGLMQDRPLLIQQLIDHAALNHGDTEIVPQTLEGGLHRYTCGCPTTCSSSR